jgi:hypothetical protein
MTDDNLNKILLCIPFGGLNDTLEQINKCFQYAIKFNRTLYVDAQHSGLLADFSKFFKFKNTANIHIFEDVQVNDYKKFNTMEVIPQEAFGRVDLKPIWESDRSQFFISDSDAPLTFDFERSYDEQLLVHAQCGGHRGHEELLVHLQFSNFIKAKIARAKLSLPLDYVSIHIRNTDYQTNYKDYFEKIYDEVKTKNIFIASDDHETIEYAINYFNEANLYYFKKERDLGGQPRHNFWNYNSLEEKIAATTEALIDLVILSAGKRLFYTQTVNGPVSGFSKLADYLCNNKNILEGLL